MGYNFEAPMTLVYATVDVLLAGDIRESITVHGLAHVSIVADDHSLRKYAEELAERHVNCIIEDLLRKHSLPTDDYSNYSGLSVRQCGIVAPDFVDIPQGGCEETIEFSNMQMIVRPISGVVMDDLEVYGIREFHG